MKRHFEKHATGLTLHRILIPVCFAISFLQLHAEESSVSKAFAEKLMQTVDRVEGYQNNTITESWFCRLAAIDGHRELLEVNRFNPSRGSNWRTTNWRLIAEALYSNDEELAIKRMNKISWATGPMVAWYLERYPNDHNRLKALTRLLEYRDPIEQRGRSRRIADFACRYVIRVANDEDVIKSALSLWKTHARYENNRPDEPWSFRLLVEVLRHPKMNNSIGSLLAEAVQPLRQKELTALLWLEMATVALQNKHVELGLLWGNKAQSLLADPEIADYIKMLEYPVGVYHFEDLVIRLGLDYDLSFLKVAKESKAQFYTDQIMSAFFNMAFRDDAIDEVLRLRPHITDISEQIAVDAWIDVSVGNGAAAVAALSNDQWNGNGLLRKDVHWLLDQAGDCKNTAAVMALSDYIQKQWNNSTKDTLVIKEASDIISVWDRVGLNPSQIVELVIVRLQKGEPIAGWPFGVIDRLLAHCEDLQRTELILNLFFDAWNRQEAPDVPYFQGEIVIRSLAKINRWDLMAAVIADRGLAHSRFLLELRDWDEDVLLDWLNPVMEKQPHTAALLMLEFWEQKLPGDGLITSVKFDLGNYLRQIDDFSIDY